MSNKPSHSDKMRARDDIARVVYQQAQKEGKSLPSYEQALKKGQEVAERNERRNK
jgi:dsRNA-specific ribonuclease